MEMGQIEKKLFSLWEQKLSKVETPTVLVSDTEVHRNLVCSVVWVWTIERLMEHMARDICLWSSQ